MVTAGWGKIGGKMWAEGLNLCTIRFLYYICSPKKAKRELSSAGSEHLPYKQRVGGSNPSAPTNPGHLIGVFY